MNSKRFLSARTNAGDHRGGAAGSATGRTSAARRRSAGEARSAADFLPRRRSLSSLRTAAAGCTGCDLYRNATQTVFGEGPRAAPVVLVGEQPGDQEDRTGHPFVGPAGRLLDRALRDAGIPREQAYVTNAVKHFKWTPRGKRRLHQRPREGEIDACNPWLAAELSVIRPRLLVCLGATAARAAFGRSVRLRDLRGQISPTPWRLGRSSPSILRPSCACTTPSGPGNTSSSSLIFGVLSA